jgi:mxaD protein
MTIPAAFARSKRVKTAQRVAAYLFRPLGQGPRASRCDLGTQLPNEPNRKIGYCAGMTVVTCSREIAARADVVWATVGNFAAVGRYLPSIATCQLEGERGVGQIRRLTLANDTTTVSRCTALDDAARSVTYQILETALPLANYSSTQTVHAIDGDRCRVTWTSRFDPSGASEEEAQAFLEEQLNEGLWELAKLHK